MRVYIAGPMRGKHNWNREAFEQACAVWESKGHRPISPWNVARELGYFSHEDVGRRHLEHVMFVDLANLASCDAVAVLPGWERSIGSTMEVAAAQFLQLPIYNAMTMEDITTNLDNCPWDQLL